MRTKFIASAAAGALLLSAGAASALTASVTATKITNSGDAEGLQYDFHAGSSLVAYESFENFTLTAGGVGANNPNAEFFQAVTEPLSTKVGDFSAIGTGNGTTRVGEMGKVAVRNATGHTGSRFAVKGDNWLDSNDTNGINWVATDQSPNNPGQQFDRLSFFSTDIDDVGSVKFAFTIGETNQSFSLATLLDLTPNGTDANGAPTYARRPNGELLFFTVAFDELIRTSNFALNIDAGDGFGVDSFRLTATPLPAAAWMLIAGVAGLFGMRRFSAMTA